MPTGMTRDALLAELSRLANTSRKDPLVTVEVYAPGSVGPSPQVKVNAIKQGIDWNAGRLILVPEVSLTALDPESVAAIRASVMKGQSWHALQKHRALADEIGRLKERVAQLEQQLAGAQA